MNRIASLVSLALLSSFAGLVMADDKAPTVLQPAPFASTLSRANVSGEAPQTTLRAPLEHSDGTAAPAPAVSANSRAFVAADTAVWMRSGLATLQAGEAGAGTSSPAYRQATAAYAMARSGNEFNAALERSERAQQARGVKAAQR